MATLYKKHGWLPRKFSSEYVWDDVDASWRTMLVVGGRGDGKGVFVQYFMSKLIYEGVERFVGTAPLMPGAEDFTWRRRDRKVVRLGDLYTHISIATGSKEDFEKLYSLQDCWFIDSEMWRYFNSEAVKKNPMIMRRYREFFSIARHNKVSMICGGQDEMQISWEMRKDFMEIVRVSKLRPFKFFGMRYHPLGFEFVVWDRDTAFSSNNRINIHAEPKYDPELFYPLKREIELFDTHSERREVADQLRGEKVEDELVTFAEIERSQDGLVSKVLPFGGALEGVKPLSRRDFRDPINST